MKPLEDMTDEELGSMTTKDVMTHMLSSCVEEDEGLDFSEAWKWIDRVKKLRPEHSQRMRRRVMWCCKLIADMWKEAENVKRAAKTSLGAEEEMRMIGAHPGGPPFEVRVMGRLLSLKRGKEEGSTWVARYGGYPE